MKRLAVAATALMALVTPAVWAHAGHGLAQGHEWFHALVPVVGAAVIVVVRALVVKPKAQASARGCRSEKQ